MKKVSMILAVLTLLVPYSVCADDGASLWSATIHAQGQDLGGVQTYEVTIGVGAEDITLPAPPLPPQHSVNMALHSADNTLDLKDIRQIGQESYMWVIGIDPHGNIMPPDARTSTLSWNPSEFGDGNYEMRKGVDGAGAIVVADMKMETSYDVSGARISYFVVIFTP